MYMVAVRLSHRGCEVFIVPRSVFLVPFLTLRFHTSQCQKHTLHTYLLKLLRHRSTEARPFGARLLVFKLPTLNYTI